MNIIDSSADVILQGSGIVGMMKHVEQVGRISYKSEDRITPDSYIKFTNMLKTRGHWSVFEHGTVYLRIPVDHVEAHKYFTQPDPNKPNFSRSVLSGDGKDYLITSNYRVVLQNGLQDLVERYWCEPTELHKKRITAHIICSRLVSHQLVRHRAFSYTQESQRYINYSKEKFGSGITFIVPQWAYRFRTKIGTTVDPQTYEPRDYILNLKGAELWNELCNWSRKVSSRDKFWQSCEDEYMYDISEEDGALTPEDSRGCLCNDTKTELGITGFVDDWIAKPDPEETTEKFGFFYLRSDSTAQSDIRVLSVALENCFNRLGIYDNTK